MPTPSACPSRIGVATRYSPARVLHPPGLFVQRGRRRRQPGQRERGAQVTDAAQTRGRTALRPGRSAARSTVPNAVRIRQAASTDLPAICSSLRAKSSPSLSTHMQSRHQHRRHQRTAHPEAAAGPAIHRQAGSMIWMTSADGSREHAFADEEIAAGQQQRTGVYQAVCGHPITPGSLVTPPSRRCPQCVDALDEMPKRASCTASAIDPVNRPGRVRNSDAPAKVITDLAISVSRSRGCHRSRAGGGQRWKAPTPWAAMPRASVTARASHGRVAIETPCDGR